MSASNIVGSMGGHSNYNGQRFTIQESVAERQAERLPHPGKKGNRKTSPEPLKQLTQIQGLIENMNSSIAMVQKSLHFRVHETSGQLVVEVQDMQTGEVIKSIPPEELLDSLGKIRESIGTLLDTEG